MGLVVGNKTSVSTNPGGNTISLTHNQNTGDDRELVVVVLVGKTVTSATYNGVAMTQEFYSNVAHNWYIFSLASPATGSNNIVINLSDNEWEDASVFATSFTGSDGIGNNCSDLSANQGSSATMTVSSNSIVMGNVYCGTNSSANLQCPSGTTVTLDYNNARGEQYTWGGMSALATAGSFTTTGSDGIHDTILCAIEVKEKATTTTAKYYLM